MRQSTAISVHVVFAVSPDQITAAKENGGVPIGESQSSGATGVSRDQRAIEPGSSGLPNSNTAPTAPTEHVRRESEHS